MLPSTTDTEDPSDSESGLDPLANVVARIEPLGPRPGRLPPQAETWEAFVLSLYPAPSEPLAPQRYKVEFIANEEYVRLIARARVLLSRARPEAGLEEIQLRALRAYVAELEGR